MHARWTAVSSILLAAIAGTIASTLVDRMSSRARTRAREAAGNHDPEAPTMTPNHPPEFPPELGLEIPTATKRSSLFALLRATRGGRVALSAMLVASVALSGVLASSALFSDTAVMATIDVTGGTLDIVANADTDDTAVAWAGNVSFPSLSNMAPGDSESATVTVADAGTVDFTMDFESTGNDPDSCFGMHVTDGTNDIVGTADSDGGVVSLATAQDVNLIDNDDASASFETAEDDSETYTITIRMLSTCTTNGATGDVTAQFVADQA